MKLNSSIILGIGLIALATFVVYDKFKRTEVVYVDTITLVEEYNMKKEMTVRLQRDFDVKKGLYDSLKTYYLVDTANMDMRRQLFELEEDVMEINKEYTNINTSVWNRINPLLVAFGKEKGYDIIIGANGMGTVLYGKPGIDITKEVLEYINKEYEDD